MRILVMHKHDKTHEGGPPDMGFIAEMGGLIGELMKTGAMKDGAGLGKTANRSRVTVKGGAHTVVHGPFARGSDNELVAEVLAITVKTRAEAVEWAGKLGALYGDAEIEVGKTTEAWDLGLEPEPPNPPLHYLLLVKATRASEAGQARSAAEKIAVDKLKKEMTSAGVLTSAVTLAPSAQAKRIQMDRTGKQRVVDGPFAESKEMVGGFVLLEMPSVQATIDFALRYGQLMLKSVETLEMDVRPLADDHADRS